MSVRTPRFLVGVGLCAALGLSACGGGGSGGGDPVAPGSPDGGASGNGPSTGAPGEPSDEPIDGPADGSIDGTPDGPPEGPPDGPPEGDDTDSAPGAQDIDDGLHLVEVVTAGADGTSATLALGWDAFGRLLEERRSADGSAAEVRRYVWGEGRRFERREDDIDADGMVDRTVEYTFGPDGRISRASAVDVNGTPVETLTWTIGEDGLVESLVRENGGTLLSRESFDHDAGGEPQSALIDSDGDGLADRVRGYEYDDDGVVSGTTLRALLDNSVIESETWRYERGACIREWMNSALRPLCVAFR